MRQQGAQQFFSVLLACALTGCGGALPLGHPAHALERGKVTLGAGVASTVVGAMSRRTAPGTTEERLQDLAIAPDVSPWASVRAGLGSGFEAGFSASSRAFRIDGRHAFSSKHWALSIGVGASGVLAALPAGGGATGVLGGGLDVPVLVGWRSTADLYSVWIGPRVGGELFSGHIEGGPPGSAPASGRHLYAGGVMGLRAGFRRLYGVLEVSMSYQHADGSIGTQALSLDGWTVAPAGALVVSF